jgi:DNA-binding transcriptional ArsR family regulator
VVPRLIVVERLLTPEEFTAGPAVSAILNHMVQYSNSLDGAFSALSDPTRRAILDRLSNGSATISELAEPAGISLTGIKKHVQVLEQAGLVSTEKRGRTRHCSLGPQRLEDAGQWIEEFRRGWKERLDQVEEIIDKKKGASR